MFRHQASLGSPKPHPYPRFDHVLIAKVANNADYANGRIEVQLDDGIIPGGILVPVFISHSGIEVKPEQGDTVLIGFLQGAKNNPWLINFAQGKHAYAKSIMVDENGITLQWPPGSGTTKITVDNQDNIQLKNTANVIITLNSQGAISISAPETINIEAPKGITLTATDQTGSGVTIVGKDSSGSW